ncbi:MAG: HAMP domain-containing sensor histidine kinase [Campylobacterota bacterium]|nr:HAMP domain-containing sensor histidine kinase [Campylobacterota bacterium]
MNLKNKKFSHFIVLIIFITSMTIVTTLNIYNTNNIINEKISFMTKSGSVKLDHQISLMNDRLSIIKNYSNSIAYMINDLEQYDQNNLSKILESYFLKDIGIFQLRILSKEGMELVRYDLDQNNKIKKASNLQDKSNRYYYKEAKNINYNDIYFSKFDLNIEHGEIEIPYKNTTRVIKKLKIDNQAYYLVINYNLTDIFKHALSDTIYDIFLIEKDGQINAHLNDRYSFSKQKQSGLSLKDLILYKHQYITKKPLEGFDYDVVISIKDERLNFMNEQRRGAITKSIIMALAISLVISVIILYFLEKNLTKLNHHALKIIEKGTYDEENEFLEFKNILEDLKIQYKTIQKNEAYINSILDSQSNFTIITDGYELKDSNRTMLQFFGFDTKESFIKEHDCICDYFIKKDGYLQKEENGISWIDKMMQDTDSNFKVMMKSKSGTTHIFQVDLNDLIGEDNIYVVTFTDITDFLELQNSLEEKVTLQLGQLREQDRQLLEQAKMSSLGEMIGNIAHQWRQPLSIISTASTGMQFKQELGILEEGNLNETCDLINENVQFLSTTIDTFRDFIQENKEIRKSILQDEIKKILKIIDASFTNEHIKIINNTSSIEPIELTMVSGELSQVLINILNNAKDAIQLSDTIKDHWIKLDLEKTSDHTIITIEDNAGGIPEDVLPKIFEPYFTTKHKSQGTGLGLHMSYKIVVESLKGKLYVQNTKNGAKFFIELPLTQVQQ